MPDLRDTKYQVAIANRILPKLGLASGVLASIGHASMRVESQPDQFVVKGRGYEIDALAAVQPEGMVVCDLDGYVVDSPAGISQCQEVKMHSCIYRTYPDVQAVVHVHPRYAVIMTVVPATLVPVCIEGARFVRTPLPIFPRPHLILSDDDGMQVANLLGTNKAILLRGHGTASVGNTLEEAVMTVAALEEQAKMNWYAYCAAGPEHGRLSDEEIDEYVDNYAKIPELPHLKASIAQQAGPRSTLPTGQAGGAWAYLSRLVTDEMEQGISRW
jgi:ribulose-5-phosphate 4-epimerase/fuculose-1-phosphate aldolase